MRRPLMDRYLALGEWKTIAVEHKLEDFEVAHLTIGIRKRMCIEQTQRTNVGIQRLRERKEKRETRESRVDLWR